MTFRTDQVSKWISNCNNAIAFGPDKLSIVHLKNLRVKAIDYLTGLRLIMSNSGDIEVIYVVVVVVVVVVVCLYLHACLELSLHTLR